ncbi:hypothetical protein ADUPG1_003588 [Aduncisulcus paluster]|uniref:Chromo domain-containing protein n=2 Tax=Aduncisulcus paluster TaxID=2918883 RepID=A0ABQ5KZ12_9EUKA|nr:hypothetical protein ADUPG1_003588 [Aduncisulcus paluster]
MEILYGQKRKPHKLFKESSGATPEIWEKILSYREDVRDDVESEVRTSDEKVVSQREQSQTDFIPFKPGEKVLLSRRKPGKKTDTINLGPFVVLEKTSSFYYRVESVNGGKKKKVHVSRMRCYKSSASEEEEKTAEAADDQEYKVERIVMHRGRGKKNIKFRVKWQDYGMEDNTWLSFKEVQPTEAFEKYVYPRKSLWYLLSEKDKKEAEDKYKE